MCQCHKKKNAKSREVKNAKSKKKIVLHIKDLSVCHGVSKNIPIYRYVGRLTTLINKGVVRQPNRNATETTGNDKKGSEK